MTSRNKLMMFGLLSISSLALGSASAGQWSYDRQGADWPGICASGLSQSPIDIDTAKVVKSNYNATINYRSDNIEAVNNGHTVQFNPDSRNINLIDNVSGKMETFSLLQFHLHNGSEHTIDAIQQDVEAHFVHANAAYLAGEKGGRLAVVGVFLNGQDDDSDDQNRYWNDLLKGLPDQTYASLNKPITPNYEALLPSDSRLFAYEGSLTTPGCNEVVNWIVMKQPINVSAEAIKSFAASQHGQGTYRSTQKVYNRVIRSGRLNK